MISCICFILGELLYVILFLLVEKVSNYFQHQRKFNIAIRKNTVFGGLLFEIFVFLFVSYLKPYLVTHFTSGPTN